MRDVHTLTHTHTLTGYNRGEPSPHIPRVCVRVEDVMRRRRRANARRRRRRRRPAACAACRVYRTRVMCPWQDDARGRSGVYISRRRYRRRVWTGIDIGTWTTLAVKSSAADTIPTWPTSTVIGPGRVVKIEYRSSRTMRYIRRIVWVVL